MAFISYINIYNVYQMRETPHQFYVGQKETSYKFHLGLLQHLTISRNNEIYDPAESLIVIATLSLREADLNMEPISQMSTIRYVLTHSWSQYIYG